MTPQLKAALQEEIGEILDIFGHAVINYGQKEGARTELKARYSRKILAALQPEIERLELVARAEQIKDDYGTFQNYGFAELYWDDLEKAKKRAVARVTQLSRKKPNL